MTAPSCANCYAPLPTEHLVEACPACGTPTRNVRFAPADVDRARATWIRVAFISFAVVFVAVPIFQLIGPNVWKLLPESAPVVRGGDDLHTLGGAATEIAPIPAAGLGPLTTFDPLAQVPWFMRLAGTWAPDARLARIELHGVRPDGTMDVSSPASDAYARYELSSATRNSAAVQQRKVVETLLWSAIDIEVKGGVVRASVVNNSNDDRPPAPLSFACTIPRLLALWRVKGLPFKQTYNLELADQRGPRADFVWQSHDWGVPKAGMDCALR